MTEARPMENSGGSSEPTPHDPPEGSNDEPSYPGSPDESIPIDPPTGSGGGSLYE
jgi:hypothetical protein